MPRKTHPHAEPVEARRTVMQLIEDTAKPIWLQARRPGPISPRSHRQTWCGGEMDPGLRRDDGGILELAFQGPTNSRLDPAAAVPAGSAWQRTTSPLFSVACSPSLSVTFVSARRHQSQSGVSLNFVTASPSA